MNIENINIAIKDLSEKRKIFHSEADFQFAFAWELQKVLPKAEIRLEYCPAYAKDMHIDIYVIENGATYPIELKYKTKLFDDDVNGEYFYLKNHGAQDCGRYDFFADIKRIEDIKNNTQSNFKAGYAIMLTNEPSYWKKSFNDDTIDADFKIHDGRDIYGTLSWSEKAGGTTKGRNQPIKLEGKYTMHWQNFSDIPETKNGTFMINIVEVK